MNTTVTRRELFVLGTASLAVIYDLPVALAAPPAVGRKRALLVAVQGYDRRDDPESASSLNTLPDVLRLKTVLMDKLGYEEADIIVLKTKDATTKAAILSSLVKFLADSRDGDVLYFHYSGHGSETINGQDYLGWDQTLVPSDYKTANHDGDIRDKELAEILANGLRDKTPAAFLLTFDCCHSGTITRDGGALNRSYIRDSTVLPPANVDELKEKWAQKQPGLISPEVIGKMKFTVISACRSNEANREIAGDDRKPMGALSYALMKALANADDKTTYRDLFERITDIMRSRGMAQTPVMEGLMDVGLLGGGVVPPASYIPVTYNGKKAILQAGELMGLREGSKLDLYPAGTKDFSKVACIAEATITSASLTTAILAVKPIGKYTMQEIEAARARVTSRVYTDKPLRVDVSKLQAYPALAEIKAGLKDLVDSKLIEFDEKGDNWDVQITPTAQAFRGTILRSQQVEGTNEWKVTIRPENVTRGATTEQVVRLRGSDPSNTRSLCLLRNGDGSLLTAPLLSPGAQKEIYGQSLGETPQLPVSIAEALRRESRRRLVTQLTGKTSRDSTQVELRIWFCEGNQVGVDDNGTPLYEWARDITALKPDLDGRFRVQLKKDQFFRVELRNNGVQPLYISILDMPSDGSLGPLWPHPAINGQNLTAFDNSVPPNKKWISLLAAKGKHALYRFTEPLGEETFIAIATPAPFDAAPLFDEDALSRGDVREIASPLGKLLRSANLRRSPNSGGVPDDWDAFSMHIEVQADSAK